ncbi:mitogen-activated protein kinase kinase kinase 7 [Drosophila grimshawi]|uniref:Mitogen-activated protein kinase kinase kinase 7 n=1 Tax=Drosophila grimshawi TaxID=7222 RepID=B4JXP2_DROGR|nr:mitogen-activated protein kinase kinase kinase 7 [Drosophila grimshawi]EDV95141.1 GH17735 [Drosophila grimshawi]
MAAAVSSPDALQAFNVAFSEITLGEKVGHGSFGVVSKAMWSNKLVAVKEFFASAEQKDIDKEVKQLSRVKHDNIIALYGICYAQQATYLIMEYAEGGSLHNFLHGKVKPAYSLAHAMSWALQCAEGVAYLHGMSPKPLIHRDLKPLNLLLTNKGRNLKICDFGTVADKSTMMTNNRGSAAWMAPEVFEGSKYTEKCDIFSWAIVLWEVLSRKPPFMDIDNAYTIQWKIHKGERPPLLDNCPKHIEQLMTACWMTAPEDRPSMQYIVSVMNEIIKDYVGADKPLEYAFINQQIVTKESDGTVAAQYDSLSHSSSDMSLASTQLTPTNVRGTATEIGTGTGVGAGAGVGSVTGTGSTDTEYTSSERTPTNSGQLDNNGLFHMSSSNRWDAIPEEDSGESQNASFNLTSSAEASKRLETIRNGMIQMASRPMEQLTLDVEPNGFELNRSESSRSSLHAKTDGRERLTVTDTKPVIMTSGSCATNNSNNTTDLTNNNNNYNINSNNNELNTNGLLSQAPNANETNDCIDARIDEDTDADVDANCGCTEQSLAEILDPELQPEPPIPNNAESQAIYRDHRHMAKEYLSVDTNLYYAQDFKEKLILQMDRIERDQKQELLRKIKDKEGLQSLYNNLQQQWEKLPAARQPNLHGGRLQPSVGVVGNNSHHSSSQELTGGISSGDSVENDGWVVIAPHHNT